MSESHETITKKKNNNNCNTPSRHSTPFNRCVHLLLKYIAIYLESNESERRKRSLFNGHYVCSNLKPSFHVASPNSYHRHSESDTNFKKSWEIRENFSSKVFTYHRSVWTNIFHKGWKVLPIEQKSISILSSKVMSLSTSISYFVVIKYPCQRCTVHKKSCTNFNRDVSQKCVRVGWLISLLGQCVHLYVLYPLYTISCSIKDD